MDLQRIRYFLEVARQKHFSRAAEICRVSQPSLSQQIKKLEEEVGGQLFQRSRGRVNLTPLGEAFLKHAQAIAAEVQSAEEFVSQFQSEFQRTIRFGAIPTIAPYLIPELFEVIRTHFPAARFELIEDFTENLIQSLLTGKIDFALLSPPTRIDEECEFLSLVKDELLLTIPSDHALCDLNTVGVGELKNERIILLENSHCLSTQTASYCSEVGLTEDFDIRSSQIDTLLGLVERGFGLTLTPAIAARFHKHRKVQFRSITPNPCFREVRIVWLQRQIISKSQKAVLKAIRAQYSHT